MTTRKYNKFVFHPINLNIQPEVRLLNCDALEGLKTLPDCLMRCWVTSPPYWCQVDYGIEGQCGHERTLDDYLKYQIEVAREMLRASTPDANLFFVIRDSYNGSGGAGGDWRNSDGSYQFMRRGAHEKGYPKHARLLIPERLSIEFTKVGWTPVLDIIWNKNDSRRGSQSRPSYAHEHVLLFAKSQKHYWNREAVLQRFADESFAQLKTSYKGQSKANYEIFEREDPSDIKRSMCAKMNVRAGAYLRSVWNIPSGAQPVIQINGKSLRALAAFPLLLARICVALGSAPRDWVGDPYAGFGTTLIAAALGKRNAIGIELKAEYCQCIHERLKQTTRHARAITR